MNATHDNSRHAETPNRIDNVNQPIIDRIADVLKRSVTSGHGWEYKMAAAVVAGVELTREVETDWDRVSPYAIGATVDDPKPPTRCRWVSGWYRDPPATSGAR